MVKPLKVDVPEFATVQPVPVMVIVPEEGEKSALDSR